MRFTILISIFFAIYCNSFAQTNLYLDLNQAREKTICQGSVVNFYFHIRNDYQNNEEDRYELYYTNSNNEKVVLTDEGFVSIDFFGTSMFTNSFEFTTDYDGQYEVKVRLKSGGQNPTYEDITNVATITVRQSPSSDGFNMDRTSFTNDEDYVPLVAQELTPANPEGTVGTFKGEAVYEFIDGYRFYPSLLLAPKAINITYETNFTYESDNLVCTDSKTILVNITDSENKIQYGDSEIRAENDFCRGVEVANFDFSLLIKNFTDTLSGIKRLYNAIEHTEDINGTYKAGVELNDDSTPLMAFPIEEEPIDIIVPKDPIGEEPIPNYCFYQYEEKIVEGLTPIIDNGNGQIIENGISNITYYEVMEEGILIGYGIRGTLDLSEVPAGDNITLKLRYSTEQTLIGSNTCNVILNPSTKDVVVARISLKEPSNPIISIESGENEFCKGDSQARQIQVSFGNETLGVPNEADGKFQISTNGVDFNSKNDNQIIPSSLEYGTYSYRYVYNYNGADPNYCTQESDPISITINKTPTPSISFDETACVNEGVEFTSTDNLSELEKSNATYQWSFGDGDDLKTSTGFKAYKERGSYPVELVVETNKGCVGVSNREVITIGAYPKLDFSYFGGCSDDTTYLNPEILNTNEFDEVASVRWYYNNNSEEMTDVSVIETVFDTTGLKPVTFAVTTDVGCADSITKNIFIQPVFNVYNYIQDFDEENYEGWISSGQINGQLENDSSSWILNDTWQGSAGVWATNLNKDTTYYNNESSYLETPCFILEPEGIQFPMLDLDIASKTDIQADGVVLEYSYDGGRTWSKLGSKDGGLGWYNAANLLGAPGTEGNNLEREGWAGDLDWQKAAFQLQTLQSDAAGEPIKFRFMFGSNADNPVGPELKGFGLNKFSIVSRNRTMVIETFLSNVKDDGEMQRSVEYLDEFLADKEESVIDIRYHINSPNEDPVFQYNPADFSAKRLHYGIDEAPRSVIDGYFGKDVDFPINENGYGEKVYDRRSLVASPFNIDLNLTEHPDKIDIEVRITKNITGEDIEDDLVLMVGMVQKQFEVDGMIYKNVLRKFIPNAGGTTIIGDWIDEDTTREEVVNLTWMTDYYNGLDIDKEYTLVAYLFRAQDIEQTKEIVQGASEDLVNGLPVPNIITGVDDELTSSDYLLYPNPANEKLTIRVPKQFSGKAEYTIYSLHGNMIESGVIEGTQNKQINTFNYSSGMYYIQIMEEGENTPVVKKFSIIK
ncbi:PKD domain-containing protein [Mangrovivirga sp. M17]|uniref:PKD domain-containing protein n=1 Tax=Mangrovivirga halotolerans TaxID=2993936 RepID=A0ABT3RLI3_9BACT|nr:PKD domain-containing protein [Mangrovivirga halotolerans]MCX2742673.1 PKD domain-containing protein [Mangrovivirga halotolerans]